MAEDADPALTKALIDALVRRETRAVRVKRWLHIPLVGRGGTGHVHRESTVLVPQYVVRENPSVLRTLTEYTGEDFGYDKRAWEQWYQTQVRSKAGNRDYREKTY
jgi:hypothetical protein